MSGFPGPHGYSEFAAGQRDRDREAARQDVPPVERSIEMHDFSDALRMRIDILSRTKVDRMTTRDLEKTVRCLEEALREIVRMNGQIEQLRHQARKAGTSEGK
jgi:hypothetical protein